MALYQLGDVKPNIDSDAYVAPEATVIGNVTLSPAPAPGPVS